MKQVLIWLSVIIYAYMLWSCANPIPLTGGEKDTRPPQVVEDGALPKNETTNFKKQEIRITFDEWVKLNNVASEVVVSPPLEKTPEIKLKNKELIFSFDEEEQLKEDATYTINFGEGVQDLTEGNPAELKYVFSTGDFIDSLVVSGSVTDANTGDAIEDCMVMLYRNLSDTIVRKSKPYYFGTTDKSGVFKIGNVKEGEYKIFALHEDQNNRYVFDSETEGIGFLTAPILVNDTMGQGLKLEVFKEEEPLLLKEDEMVDYGHAWFTFNREPYDLIISYEDKGQNLRYDYRKDSVHIWYDTEESFEVYLANDTLWKDTVLIKAIKKTEFLEKGKLLLQNEHEGVKKINKQEGILLQFSKPVTALDNSLIDIYADTTQTLVEATGQKDTTLFGVEVLTDWVEGIPYEVVLLPGAVTDMFGLKNDTINLSYLMQKEEAYGEIQISFKELDESTDYIVKLKTKSNPEIKRYIISGLAEYNLDLRYMTPGDYTIEIVEDSNKNGRWDTGSYDDLTYPEKIYTQSLETLRANWTVEAEVLPSFKTK